MSPKPKVDIAVPFAELPRTPSKAFPWLDKEPFLAPLRPIMLKMPQSQKRPFRTVALLDTGAGVCIFGSTIADALDINWRSCPDIEIAGFGGNFKGYGADVQLIIPGQYAWDARVVFSPAMDRGPYSGILGYNGFFEFFKVRFSGPNFRVTL